MPYNMEVNEGNHRPMNLEYILGVSVDICTRTFLLFGDQGREQAVICETPEQFLNVLEVVNDRLRPDQIAYAEVAIAQ
jgi:hypothetical protein